MTPIPVTSRVQALAQSDRQLSIRLRLTLWNVSVVVLILLGLGIVLRYALGVTLLGNVDHDLDHAVRGFADIVQQQGTLPTAFPGPPRSMGGKGPLFFDPQGTVVPPSRNLSATPYDGSGFRSALATGKAVHATVTLDAQPFRILSFPLRGPNGRVVFVAQLPRPLDETDREVARLTRLLFLLAGPGVLLAGLGGAFLTSRALRPVRFITHAAARIEAEDLSRRLAVTGQDELSELAATFNGMLARLEDAFRERQAAYTRMEQAYEQQQRFTADASHELKSPLTVIEGTVSLNLASAERTPAQYRRALETIQLSAGRMTRIVQDLLLLARSDAGHLDLAMRPVSVYDLLTVAHDSLGEPAVPHAPIVLPDHDPRLLVNADPAHLVRLLVNLLENARRHTPPDGQIAVSITAENSLIQITVRDTGTGIPAEDVRHVFDRFYRVDAARARTHGGTGLGLAICRSIAEAHGGTLRLESVLGSGTQVTLHLPRHREAQTPGNSEKALSSDAEP